MSKPPLGLMPRSIWLTLLEVPTQPSIQERQAREAAIFAAINRYTKVGIVPPRSWLDEYWQV